MVTPRQIKPDPVRQGTVILTGGINESVTTLELKPGELLQCSNYMEIDGPYGGQVSTPGYEVYDGTPLASEIDVELLSTDPDTGEETWDDADREARRAAITPVPGIREARGVHQFDGDVYAQRDLSLSEAKVYRATSIGWLSLTGTDLNPGGSCRWVNARFSKFPTAGTGDYPPVMTNQELMFWVDGVSKPHSWDGYTIRVLDHANLPSNDAFSPAPVYPTCLAAFDNRLFLAFPGGHLFYSSLGDPSDWATNAGSIPCGDEITGLVVAPGNALVVLMRNSIKILYLAEQPTEDFIYQLKEFSPRSGGLFYTESRMLGDVYFADDRGPTSMKTTDAFGDFKQNTITRKTQRTFLRKKNLITCAVSAREYSQYRLYFSDKTAMYFTFENKKVKGVGYMKFNHAVKHVTEAEGDDGRAQIFFTADDNSGYVYKMDSGTSFNGDVIKTYLATSYYHYNAPTAWKHFIGLTFEMSADNGTRVYVATDYDYADRDFGPKNPLEEKQLAGLGGVWGSAVWGDFIWGGAYIQRPKYYVYGYGTNMSVAIRTEDKYRDTHIIHNFIAEYSLHDRRL